jgi:3D (Asp-Asp-Asp) domain-containing protein
MDRRFGHSYFNRKKRTVPVGAIITALLVALLTFALATYALRESQKTLEALDAEISAQGHNAPPEAPNARQTTPVKPQEAVGATYRNVTAYTSRAQETDSTPCIAADGSDICRRAAAGENLCAANFVPFGTTLAIGDDLMMTCIVADRMNSRHGERVDLYFGHDLKAALEFGIQTLPVTILK